jgi:hypothetical protein
MVPDIEQCPKSANSRSSDKPRSVGVFVIKR